MGFLRCGGEDSTSSSRGALPPVASGRKKKLEMKEAVPAPTGRTPRDTSRARVCLIIQGRVERLADACASRLRSRYAGSLPLNDRPCP